MSTYGGLGGSALGARSGSGPVEVEDDHLLECFGREQGLSLGSEETLEALDGSRGTEEVAEQRGLLLGIRRRGCRASC